MTAYKIEVPPDYFARTAARDYSDDAGMAVIREFAQNAADAGATRVSFTFDNGILTVMDNGKGCDARTVREVLLNPLASQKDAGSVGGFGKAKELLYLANPLWTIRTRDVFVKGSCMQVQEFTTGLAHEAGFIAAVQLPEGLYAAAQREAKYFLQRSERPGVEWLLNGAPVLCGVTRPRRAVKDFGFCRAYVDRDVKGDSYVYLRTQGLLTSVRWGGHDAQVGRVIIELTGNSVDLLTPARDWFRSTSHRAQVESWLNQLVVNARRTLADEQGDEILFEDFEVVEDAAPAVAAAPVEGAPKASTRAFVPSTGGIEASVSFRAAVPADAMPDEATVTAVGAALAEALTEAQGAAPAASPALRPAPRRADGFDMGLMPRLDGVKRVVVHTGGKAQAKVAMRWLKKNSATASKALAAWTSAVRVVAQRAGLPVDAVGFTFSEQAEAEFVRAKNGRFGMMLNPTKIDLSDEFAADELLDRALHEAAHLCSPGGHDESFVCAEAALRRKARGSMVRGTVNRALRTGAVATLNE